MFFCSLLGYTWAAWNFMFLVSVLLHLKMLQLSIQKFQKRKFSMFSDYLQATDGEYIIAICHLSDSGTVYA